METERCPFNGVDCEYIPLAQKVTEQSKEIDRLRAALHFYADMENYIQVDQSTVFVPIITVDLQPQLDNGRTARAALGEE
jgi:hypothetical protein